MAVNLRKQLKNSFKGIKNHIEKGDISPWITDNFYIIKSYYDGALKDKNAFEFSKIHLLLAEFCHRNDYSVEIDELISFLNGEGDFSHGELNSIPVLLGLCALMKIDKALIEGDSEMIPPAVKLLISLSDPDYEKILPSLWKPEKVLEEKEEKYKEFHRETKGQYRRLLAEYAKKRGVSEIDAAEQIKNRAENQGTSMGELLFAPKKRFVFLWWGIILALFASLSALAILKTGWLAIPLAVPLGGVAIAVGDIVLSACCPVMKAPRLELEKIPDDAKTLVAVAALLTGNESDDEVFESLKRFRYMNPDENIYFCLLADLPDSGMQFRLEDSEIINNARKKIDELNENHGNRFCLFLRERVLNKSENLFGGWERKRGAVCELVSHICRGDKQEYYGGEFIREIKYLLTLDSDTNLSVDSVKEMVSLALHPVNRPVLEGDKIKSGYGIIQPTVRTELSSAYRTGFSRLITGTGGADIYANAEFRRSQSLFGLGSFCGKGLINVELFNRLVCPKIPEGLVLSHDAVEGSIMHTLCASDVTLTDSTPCNTVSYYRREHRWLRGDFQNLYFLKGKILDSFSKFRLFATAFRHTVPLFAFVALALGAFERNTKGLWLVFFAFSDLLIPWVISVVRGLFVKKPFAVVRFFSISYTLFAQSFLRLLFEITATARKAALVFHAYCLAFIRLFTRRKTLEWTTAAQTERLSSTLGKYVLDGWFSVVSGLCLFLFALPPFVKLSGLLFFVYSLVSAVLARPLDGGAVVRPELGERDKKILYAHVSDMFRFYYENVDEATNHLPPDNIQLSPVNITAMRTSPTNIGFYLVSLLGAYDLQMINKETLISRLNLSLSTIEGLEKYRGNLYNWYNLNDLSVLGNRYVSTVDSGNFIVMLVALKEGLYSYSADDSEFESLARRCERLINETDLKPLYDKKKDLFYIGITAADETPDKSHYDMLMSEARMTAYYAVASSIVPKRHWQKLGRTLAHRWGYMGMMSWSGTAFEYFMPQLFMPLYKDSFLYESLAFALMVQRSENKIWGVSESGFYSFDSDMNYQYKANGIQTLALRRVSDDERVISPYSTYLSLCITSSRAMKNLERLENRGMYGKYGFYEAMDMNGESGIAVKSYMAHHVGMSIIAAVNALKDNIFVKRFMQDKCMCSAGELLREKIPVDAFVFGDEGSRDMEKQKKIPLRASVSKPNRESPKVALLSRGDFTAAIADIGHIGLYCGNRILANTVFDKYSLRFTPGVIFSRGGRAFGCASLYGDNENYSFQQGDGFASHIASGKDFSGCVRYSVSKNSQCLVINTRGENLKKYDISLVFEPILRDEKGYRSHISFSRLFLESEYDEKKRILYFHRRSNLDGRHIFTLAVASGEKDMNCSFLTDGSEISAGTVHSPACLATVATDNKAGACVDPLCIFRANDVDGGKAIFLVTCGETKAQCEKNIRLARGERGDYPSHPSTEISENMLSDLLYNKAVSAVSEFSNCSIGDLWSRGISGDYPISLIFADRIAINRTKEIINAFLTLNRSFINSELIFVISETDNYSRPVENSVKEVCRRLGALKFVGKNRGIFLLRRDEISESLITALENRAEFCLNGNEKTKHESSPVSQTIITPEKALSLPVPDDCVATYNGFFCKDGFVVDKSRNLLSPYSHVLTGYRFSTVLTQSSLGYTFFDNARERRLCSFCGDVKSLDDGERIFALSGDKRYDLCAMSHKVIYKKGRADYHGIAEGNEYIVTVTIHPKYPIKLIRVQFTKKSMETLFALSPVMGDSILPVKGVEIKEFAVESNRCLMFLNSFGITYPEGRGFAGVVGGRADAKNCRLYGQGRESIFFLGSASTVGGGEKTASVVNKGFFEETLSMAEEFANNVLPPLWLKTQDEGRDALMNFFLPYQVAACRFYARGSFYQSGGAYGFRDQLQDCLTLVYSSPQKVKNHIIRCCAHQYIDGSVMHWWHTRCFGRVNRGIKSKCSDDMLYLPLVVADYWERTDDTSLLDIIVGYVTSPPLGHKSERYEQPDYLNEKESVYHHCLRALDCGYKIGKNGLLLMGSCDWNDAFSLVGERGEGESVFTTMLYVAVAQKFLPLAELKGDKTTAERLLNRISTLKSNLEEKAYFGDRYARAICDDGRILGIDGCGECEIDILSQAFAAIIGLDKERTKTALKTAFNRLYDKENKIFHLFSPPFDKGDLRVGYIRGYVAGIRENGGQYTHGALWGALGCFAVGMNDEALAILECADPSKRCEDRRQAQKYRNEPYVISADIYGGEYKGRGGWSWYTGAASWFYKIMLEQVLGLKFNQNGVILSATPKIPFRAQLQIGSSMVRIYAEKSFERAKLNGEPTKFPVSLPLGNSDLELPIE